MNHVSTQAWIAAHVRREFPRLACGAIWMDGDGTLRATAMPNSHPSPGKWLINPNHFLKFEKSIARENGFVIGFYSSRASGKPPTPEEILGWLPFNYWVVSTNSDGRASEHAVYGFQSQGGQLVPYPVTEISRIATAYQDAFADQNVAISRGLQVVNAELMKWLRSHPEDLIRVHPGTFELIIAEIFKDQGFEVEVLGSWNQSDGGIDVIAIRKDTLVGDFRVGIQCKRYVKTRIVRADLVWALEGRLEKFHLHKGVLATTAKFEESVLADIESHLWRIELRDFNRLKTDLEAWGQFERGTTGIWLPK